MTRRPGDRASDGGKEKGERGGAGMGSSERGSQISTLAERPGGSTSEKRARRRELYIILGVIPLVILLTYIESHISIVSGDIPVATNILVLGLININVILILLLIFLVLRNTVKLFYESRRKVMGSRLRTKLITSFVGLTIIPTILLFIVVIGFINKSIDGWFDINVEGSLEDSLDLAQSYYKDTNSITLSTALRIGTAAKEKFLFNDREALREFIFERLASERVSTIEVYDSQLYRIGFAMADNVNSNMVPDIDPEKVRASLVGDASNFVETIGSSDVVRGIVPVLVGGDKGTAIGAVVVSYYIPKGMSAKIKDISAAFDGYKQLKLLKNPVKTSYFTILLVITFLIIFFSIWIGRYLAKEITVPISELADGTHKVAGGNLDFKIDIESNDEVGVLVNSFNRMTEDLKESKIGLEDANLDLRDTNAELEERRRYIEIVLANVPAGVISIDREGRITAQNKVASEILGTPMQGVVGKNYDEVLRLKDVDVVRNMIKEMSLLGVEYLERQMQIKVKGNDMTVLVNLTALRDERGEYLGMVAVLDDLTHLLKTQRMFAWKEVARRIAHEIKNPLTPIQLSAQRLRKKYMGSQELGTGEVFDECTKTIIRQVEDLKTLVNEFSSFARMPTANLSQRDLNDVVTETMELYKTGHKDIEFEAVVDEDLPDVDIDRDQIKRVLINLVDNGIASIEGTGRVTVQTSFDPDLQLAIVEVGDTGCGIPEDYKGRLFEPYFSTKRTGTGLGLAIVSNIIADHNGYIRVKDNTPKGTVFIIELPIKGARP